MNAAFGRDKRPEWEKKFDPRVGFRCLDFGVVPDQAGSKNKARSAFTLITVLEKIVSLGGTHIRLFGVDMAGTWRIEFDDEAGCQKDEGWDRWKHERETLQAMIEKAEPLGIRIEIQESPAEAPEA